MSKSIPYNSPIEFMLNDSIINMPALKDNQKNRFLYGDKSELTDNFNKKLRSN